MLREAEHTPRRVALTMEFDPSFRFDRERVTNPNSPLPLPGLGLAFWVNAVVDAVADKSPAAEAGLQPKDVIEAVRFQGEDAAGKTESGPWNDIKANQWAMVNAALQGRSPPTVGLRVKRGDQTPS